MNTVPKKTITEKLHMSIIYYRLNTKNKFLCNKIFLEISAIPKD